MIYISGALALIIITLGTIASHRHRNHRRISRDLHRRTRIGGVA
jgi:hypothetical protein